MTDSIIIFPLSADPMTAGHVSIVERAVKLFPDRTVHVVIADNPDKKCRFTIDQQLAIAKASLSHLGNKVVVVSHTGITTNYARKHNATVMIRGVRNGGDLEYEMGMEQFTRSTSDMETIYLSPYTEHTHTSSSLVRTFINCGHLEKTKQYMQPLGFSTMFEIIDNDEWYLENEYFR